MNTNYTVYFLLFMLQAFLPANAQNFGNESHQFYNEIFQSAFPTNPLDMLGILQNFQLGHENISIKCSIAINKFGAALLNMDFWAMKVVDAFGKLGSGVTEGNLNWPGSYRLCTSIVGNGTDEESQYKPQYCWSYFGVKFKPEAPNERETPLKIGLCMPGACSTEDMMEMFTKFNSISPTINKYITFTQVSCIPPKQNIKADDKAVACLWVCGVVVVIIGIATLYDVYLQRSTQKKRLVDSTPALELTIDETASTKSITSAVNVADEANFQPVDNVKKRGRRSEIFLCLSYYKNAAKMFDLKVPEDSLTCLNGIRVLSMAWIILGHTYVVGAPASDNIMVALEWADDISYLFISQGTLAVDSFFVLSGLLVMYLYLKARHSNEKFSWLKFYFHRYWRLTPVYIAVLFLFEDVFSKYYSYGPYWSYQGLNFDNCEKNWWWNILYINNFLKGADMCMGHSWYLANDMQFYVISPLILIFVIRYLPVAGLISGSIMIASWVYTFMIVTMNNLNKSAYPIGNDVDTALQMFDDVYTKPYCRIAPYIIGMYCGYLIYECKGRVKLNKLIILFGWLIALCLSACATLAIYRAPMGPSWISMYLTFFRSGWAISLSWLIFACCNGYGGIINGFLSWPIWQPLSRLTYSAYLIHWVIVRVYFTSMDFPPHFSHLFLIYNFIGNFVLTYLSAVVISLVFESPMLAVEKLFIRRN